MDPAKIMSFSCPHDQTFTYYLDDRASIQATVVSTLVAIPATISLNVLLIVAVIREKLPQNHTYHEVPGVTTKLWSHTLGVWGFFHPVEESDLWSFMRDNGNYCISTHPGIFQYFGTV